VNLCQCLNLIVGNFCKNRDISNHAILNRMAILKVLCKVGKALKDLLGRHIAFLFVKFNTPCIIIFNTPSMIITFKRKSSIECVKGIYNGVFIIGNREFDGLIYDRNMNTLGHFVKFTSVVKLVQIFIYNTKI